MDLAKINELAKKLANELNVELTFMGSGEHGVAYDIGKNRVLKITTERNEVNSADKLVGVNLKYGANIYDVKQLTDDYYMIIMEKLEPISSTLESEILQIQNILIRKFNLDIRNDIKRLDDEGVETYKAVVSRHNKNFPLILDAYWNIIKEYLSHGVVPSDINVGNLGMKGGNIAAFDVMTPLKPAQ